MFNKKLHNPQTYHLSRRATLLFAIGLGGFYIYPFGESTSTPWLLNFMWIAFALSGIAQLLYRSIVVLPSRKILWLDVLICCFVSIFPLISPLSNSIDGLIALCLFVAYEVKITNAYC